MGVKLASSSGGSVEIVSPVTASNYTATMPAITGTVMVGDAYGNLALTGAVIYNSQTINTSFTMPDNINAQSAGPITIATGVTVTIGTGSYWVINGA